MKPYMKFGRTLGVVNMRPAVKFGLILGVVIGAFYFAMAALGLNMFRPWLHMDRWYHAYGFAMDAIGLHANVPAPTAAFVVVPTVVSVILVYLTLRETASTAAWTGQLVNGLMVGVTGAVLFFFCSWATNVVVSAEIAVAFPELDATWDDAQASPGVSADQINSRWVTAAEQASAEQGFMAPWALGALSTSLIAGAVIGIFKRQGK